MRRYSTDHTGPNTALGGLNAGFLISAYHVVILLAVFMPDTKPMVITTAMHRMRMTIFGKGFTV
jgi:hypothetical protein